ncbi:hypothetical protein PS3A_16280 [Pseudomonas sp. 3A(2025)]
MIDSPLEYGIGISANSLAGEIGLKSVPDTFGGVWDVLLKDHGYGNFSPVDALLQRTLGPLNRVSSNISGIHRHIDHYCPDISAYPLAAAVGTIESIYRDYHGLLGMLQASIREQAAGSYQGAADRLIALGRLGALGSRVGSEIGANLKTLQRLLNKTDSGFIDPFYQQQRERDFVSFFYATKFYYARFYLAQIKAFMLLHLVDRDPCVPYRLTTELKGFEEELRKGEFQMFCTLHQPVKDMVQRLVAGPQGIQGGVAVSLRSPYGNGLKFDRDNVLQVSQDIQEWWLEPVEPLVFNPHIDHHFRLRHAASDKWLFLDGPQRALGVRDEHKKRDRHHRDDKALAGWAISFEHGPMAFRLKYQGQPDDPNSGKHLVSYAAAKPGEYKVESRLLSNPFDRDRHFYFHSHEVSVKEKLLVDEYLRPGDYLRSAEDTYRLYYRHQGAVEMVRTLDNKVLWAGGTQVVLTSGRLLLQPDGNFVAYNDEGMPYWASGKYFKDQQSIYRNSVLKLRPDGRLEIGLPGKEAFWLSPA